MPSQFLRRWWNQPHNYESIVRDFDKYGALRPYRVAAALSTFAYGLSSVALLFTADPPTSAVARGVLIAAGVSTVFVGAAWLRGPWPTKPFAIAFGVFADVGVAAALLSYGSPPSIFLACALFATSGIFIQLFLSPRLLSLHLAWSGVMVALMFVLVLLTPGADKGLAVVQLLALLPISFMGPTFLQYLLLKFQDHAAEANVDPLTGLNNRRGLDERLAGYLSDATQVSVMVIDIDRFKAINDRYGHHIGDSVLEMTARRLSVGGVLVARTGGEEFAVVTNLGEHEATVLAEHLRRSVYCADDLAPTTVSIGVAPRHCDFRAADSADIVVAIAALLRRADSAMYEAKGQGGNMVVAAAADGRSPRTVL